MFLQQASYTPSFGGLGLNERWSDWLDGLAIHLQEDGTSVLVGPVVDQAALHGVIARIRDLGLPLLSVRRVVEAYGRTK